jgi:hypothetical protein
MFCHGGADRHVLAIVQLIQAFPGNRVVILPQSSRFVIVKVIEDLFCGVTNDSGKRNGRNAILLKARQLIHRPLYPGWPILWDLINTRNDRCGIAKLEGCCILLITLISLLSLLSFTFR